MNTYSKIDIDFLQDLNVESLLVDNSHLVRSVDWKRWKQPL